MPSSPHAEPTHRSSGVALRRVIATVLSLLALLPLASWIPGGHQASWYGSMVSEWLSGTVITFGLAVVAFIVMRRFEVWPTGLAQRAGALAVSAPVITGLALGALCLALYSAVAVGIFDGRPLHIDELVQVMQARIFAEGRLARPAFDYPEFFAALNVVDVDGRVFSHFPPGGPLMLLPGVLLGAPWLGGPLAGAVAAAAFWFLARDIESSPAVALGGALLLALSPFALFMAGSQMNHMPTLMWLCIALASLRSVVRQDRPLPSLALVTGLSFGVMASIRPVDAAAFAVPAAIWLLWRTARAPATWRDLISAGIGVSLPLAGVLVFNAQTTGSPFLFGYELLWGEGHGLGFHQAPWGLSHTPLRGLELINVYLLRMQVYVFETPIPSLLPALVALGLTPVVRAFDRYLLWSSAALLIAYFAYWHDGFYLGPRFVFPLLPVVALWTARLPALVRDRVPRFVRGDRVVLIAYTAAAAVALLVSVPARARQYDRGLASMRLDYVAPAREMGVGNAVVLVRESWGAQLVARMWGLGVSRSASEGLYRSVDACVLELAISRLESSGIRGDAAGDSLVPLVRDSARLTASTLSPDGTERMLAGVEYPALCMRRIAEDRAGYTFLAPLLAADPGSNVYARDLHARDTLLLRQYAGRPVYVLTASPGNGLGLAPLDVDSARAEWAANAVAAAGGALHGRVVVPAAPARAVPETGGRPR